MIYKETITKIYEAELYDEHILYMYMYILTIETYTCISKSKIPYFSYNLVVLVACVNICAFQIHYPLFYLFIFNHSALC